MRLRSFMLAVSALGACGAILLAADMYRRLVLAENAAASGASLVYGMAHVIGVAALAMLFLAHCLLLISDVRPNSVTENGLTLSAPNSSNVSAVSAQSSKIPTATLPETSATLILFTKLPEPGRVKTRLIPALGEDGAARLAAAMLMDLVDQFSATLDSKIQCVLCFDAHLPAREAHDIADAEWRLRELLGAIPGAFHRFEIQAQSSGDLGERLTHALKINQSFRGGPCVFIGSDALVTPTKVEQALEVARSGRACLFPAEDGGYVLLAIPGTAPLNVFDNIAWSSKETAKQQAAKLESCGFAVELLSPPFFDVDDAEDLPRLKEFLALNPGIAERTSRVLAG